MNNRLNIYACSGIGGSEVSRIEDRLNYEMENSNTLDNSRAMNMLLSQINYLRAKFLYGGENNAYTLNELDKYAVCYWFARKYRDDESALKRIGYNIGIAVERGDFNSTSVSLSDHEEIVETLIERIEDESGDAKDADSAFVKWWFEYVVENNEDAATEEDRKLFKQAIESAVSGIGATDKYGINSDSDLSKYLNDAGSYFVYYMCLTEAEAKQVSAKASYKRRKQKEVYDYCCKCFVGLYGTEESMIRIIETGIMETTGRSLDKVHDQIMSGEAYGKGEGVGVVLTATAIATIVTAVMAVIAALVTGLLEYAKAKVSAKYTVPSNTDAAIMSEDDYTGTTTASAFDTKTLLLFAGAATIGYFMFGDNF